MSLQFQAPQNDPGQEIRKRWASSIDDIFATYQQAKQQALAERDRVGNNLLQNGGIDPRQVTPMAYAQSEQMAAFPSQGPALPGQMSPLQQQQQKEIVPGLMDFIARKKQSQMVAQQEAGAKLANTQADTVEKTASAAEKEALAKLLSQGGSGQPQVEEYEGVKYLVHTTLRGEKQYTPIPERQPSQNEFVARGYADKATEADAALKTLMQSGFDPTTKTAGAISSLPDFAQTSNVKALENAKKMFGNAIARRESGATIKDDEMARYNLMYFPSTGDSQEILAQKARNRELAIKNLAAEGGRVKSQLESAPKVPKVGTVEGGYRFKGGDPSKPESWEKQ